MLVVTYICVLSCSNNTLKCPLCKPEVPLASDCSVTGLTDESEASLKSNMSHVYVLYTIFSFYFRPEVDTKSHE